MSNSLPDIAHGGCQPVILGDRDNNTIFKIRGFFKISPEQRFYVGGSLVDWQTAKAAGLTLVAYQNKNLEIPWKMKYLLEIKEILDAFGSG